MAEFQLAERILLTFFATVCFGGSYYIVESCQPNSKELHICLNIYLEKDFPFIETIVKGRKQGRVLLEDPDLENICSHVSSLMYCYKDLLKECDSYWNLDRYSRMMQLMKETLSYLCSNRTEILRDLLLNSGCLQRANDYLTNCSQSGFSWLTTWKEILRMQVAPGDKCPAMARYKTCLADLPDQICGKQAAMLYIRIVDVWLRNWCNSDGLQGSELGYLYQPMIFLGDKV